MLWIGNPGSSCAVTRQRVNFRLEPDCFGKSRPRLIQIAAQSKRPREIQVEKIGPGACRARLSEQIDRLVHMPQQEMALPERPLNALKVGAARI